MLKMESSPERDHFIKLSYILLDVVARHLRELFVKLWDKKYQNEKWNDDVEKRNRILQSLLVTRDGRQKKDIYSQKILNGDEQKWDITTSIKAIMDPGLQLIDGCRPLDQETSTLLEKIDIIREIRNTYYGHISSMSCSLDDFCEVVDKIKHAAKHLFGREVKMKIHKIEAHQITPDMREQVDKLRKEMNEDLEKMKRDIEEMKKDDNEATHLRYMDAD